MVGRYFERNQGLWRSIRRGWSRFTNHSLGVIGLVVLTGLIVMAVFAPFIAPHPLTWQAPETGDGDSADSLEELAEIGIEHPAPPQFGNPYFAPLGTDHEGKDILTHLIYGSRIALYVGLAAGILSSLVGVPLGLISGFYGDTWIDETIQRVIDVMYGLPFLPLVIVLVAVNGITTTNIILAIVVKSWLNNAIVIRGETLSLKERSYVEAAKVAGASDNRIVFRHILPNVLPLAFVYLAQDAAFAILTQANLAFIGLADISNVSWATMLQWIQVTGNIFTAPWWLIPPGLMITALSASFYFIGYSMEDVMNPHTES
jgi:peptide/nickel transport system permease protein